MASNNIQDIVIRVDRAVTAVYMTNPAILERDEQRYLGAPFLFMVPDFLTSEQRYRAERTPFHVTYFGQQDQIALLKKSPVQSGELPDKIIVDGKRVPKSRYAPNYVPYGLGHNHSRDIGDELLVRDRANFDLMVHQILPDVAGERAFLKQQEREAQKPLNRLLATLGMYQRPQYRSALR